jgi:hypothetical protein
MRMALNYQKQESGQTLAEGFEEYYRANVGKVARPDDLPPESAALFRNHHMCHVIFGPATALADEWRRKKRWPWQPTASYLDRTLCQLRHEHGIRVI